MPTITQNQGIVIDAVTEPPIFYSMSNIEYNQMVLTLYKYGLHLCPRCKTVYSIKNRFCPTCTYRKYK